jgi:tetratricopeptide (TPR) repeat protein
MASARRMDMSRSIAVLTLGCLLGLATLHPLPLGAQRIELPAGLAELESRAKKDSNDAAAHYNVALAFWNEKRYDAADSALHWATRIEPEFAAAYMALSYLPYARRSSLADEMRENRVPQEWEKPLEESGRMYRRAAMIDPLVEQRLTDILTPRNTAYLEGIKILYGEWFADYYEGFDLYRQGKYQEAYDRYQRVFYALKGDRHKNRMWNTLLYWHGLAAAHTNKHDEAVLDFQTLLERYLDTENQFKDSSLQHVPLRTNEFRYILAVMQQRAGHSNEAIALFREALQNDLGLYMAHVRLADIYEDHGLMPQATAERRAAVDANPEDATLVLALGKTLARVGQWADAEKAMQQAAEENPRDARIPYLLGIIEQQLKKPTEAKAAFTRFLSLAPSRYAPQINDAKQRLAALP